MGGRRSGGVDEAMYFAVYADAATKYFGTAAQQAPDDLQVSGQNVSHRGYCESCERADRREFTRPFSLRLAKTPSGTVDP